MKGQTVKLMVDGKCVAHTAPITTEQFKRVSEKVSPDFPKFTQEQIKNMIGHKDYCVTMELPLLDSLYIGINTFAKNNNGEYPKVVILHVSKKPELINNIAFSSNSAAQFDYTTGHFFVFGVKVCFDTIIQEDTFVCSGIHP